MAYKITDPASPYSVTVTLEGWIDLFTRECYRKILVDSLTFCVQRKGLCIHSWTIMSNHLHMVISSDSDMNGILRDMKQYTAKEFIRMVQTQHESRRKWLLHMFEFHAKFNKKNKEYQVWNTGYHAVELTSDLMIEQRIDYIEDNPVRAGIVRQPEHYIYCSAGSPELIPLTEI